MDKLTGKKLTNIKPVKGINTTGKNFFATKHSVGDFWNFTGTSYEGKSTLWPEDIRNQIHQVELQTEEYKKILANPFGQNINLIG